MIAVSQQRWKNQVGHRTIRGAIVGAIIGAITGDTRNALARVATGGIVA